LIPSYKPQLHQTKFKLLSLLQCVSQNDFIILLLYEDDMLVVGHKKAQIQDLNAQLTREFDMKDLRPTNKILGI